MLNSSPSEMDEKVASANRTYHDAISSTYEADPRVRFGVMNPNVVLRFNQAVLAHFPEQSHRQLALNLGCGTGNQLPIHQELFAHSFALDISISMLELVKTRLQPLEGISLLNGNGLHLPLKDAQLDCVSGFALLHHFFSPRLVLKEIHRVLRPGGLFYNDYEPNLFFFRALRSIALFRVLLALYKWVSSRAIFQGRNSDLKETMALAEYHSEVNPGLNPHDLHADLVAVGFSNVRVIPHSDGPDLERPLNGRFVTKLLEILLRLNGFAKYAVRTKTFAIMAVK